MLNRRKLPNNRRNKLITTTLLITFIILTTTVGVTSDRPFLPVLLQDDLKDGPINDTSSSTDEDQNSVTDWDEFGESDYKSDDESDPGTWRPIFEPNNIESNYDNDNDYYVVVRKLVESVSGGESSVKVDALAVEIEKMAEKGDDPNILSLLGFLYSYGIGREKNDGKAFMYHSYASQGGNMQSKLALAYTYSRRQLYEKAVLLYAELAKAAVSSFFISKDSPVIVPVRIHSGSEENKEALRKSRGEEDEDFWILEYQAKIGNSEAMYKIGLFYYFGLKGVRRDHAKALFWFSKAVDKREPRSMELLGEIYARGVRVKRNYTTALEWFTLASKQQLYSAYIGMGYLYLKGYGVEQRNNTKAKEYFEKAAENKEAGGHYNLGVMYLKGIGVKRDVKLASKYFEVAANAGQPKAFYQLAKMFHTGIGLTKNLPKAISLYKFVAERGPWSSLSRWALESYLKGEVGKAFLLYSKMAELGYEVTQSNAAWILYKYGKSSMCMGESGLCTDAERHQRARSLLWRAYEQGNEHAALLIGDAYYYGRGTERDYDRAADAYMHAKANAQAIFNLGYMHEHGQGLPLDLRVAKRYYEQALKIDSATKLIVMLAFASLWVRSNYPNSFLVDLIDSLPDVYNWIKNVVMEEGNTIILTFIGCLLTAFYLREQRRRRALPAAGLAPPPWPNGSIIN